MRNIRQELDKDLLNLPGLMFIGHNISLEASLPLKTHIHQDCLEIVVIIKGNECYYVENERFELSGGNVFISFVNQPHRSGNAAQGVCELIWFLINPSINENFLGLSNEVGQLIKKQILKIDTHVLKVDNESIFFLKKSFENFTNFEPGNRIYAQSLFISFLSKLLFLNSQSGRDDALIKKILPYIDENIYNIIKIEDICSVFNISLSGFKHKFKEYTGVTPRDYINSIKVLKAKELLKEGKSVTETAMRLSFNTSNYFSVVFRKYTSCSPSKFR